MCGFAGIVDFRRGVGTGDVLDTMAETIAHRGPDERGMLIDGACGLAHRRLSIVDLLGSQQPMALPGCDVSLAYNGELYNFAALSGPLLSEGTRLTSRGDTEVLLRWVAKEWTRALPRFDGMFAFAAWDRVGKRLLLARDPIGEKPLFYAMPRPDLIVFGSEVKAVRAHPEVSQELDQDSLREVLRFRAVYGPRTLFRGVKQLSPGHYLEFGADGARVERYYDLIADTRAAAEGMQGMSGPQLVQFGKELLTEAVRERLMADVPLGVFLSGGLDSSLIAALMRRLLPDGIVRSFSVGFEDDPHSELGYARTVANAMGAIHTEVAVGPDEFQSRLSALSAHRDGPVSEPADVAVAALSRVAKQHVKVVLSGEGGDEVFAGYPKYMLARLPMVLRRACAFVGPERISRWASYLGLDRRRSLVAARALSLPRERDRLVQWFSYLDRDNLRTLLPGLDWNDDVWEKTASAQDEAFAKAAAMTRIGRMQAVDCLSWLPGNMLERGDRMTMSEGLEMRPPFLDKQLVAFGLALPDRMKVRGRWTKWIVRQWGLEELPESIHRRPKWGFRVPLAQWFRGPLREMLFDHLTNPRGLCGTFGNRRRVLQLLNDHDCGARDANLQLWGLLAAEVWYQGASQPALSTARVPRDREPAPSL